MSTKVELAAALAKHFHAGQNYGEKDSTYYPLKGVMCNIKRGYKDSMSFTLSDAILVAWLLDLFDENECRFDSNYDIFGVEVVDTTALLIKDDLQSMQEYLSLIKKNPLATFVKICDAEFNRDSCLSDGDEKRAKYYQDTIDYLKGE